MKKRELTKKEIILAKKMQIALSKNNFSVPYPKIVSIYRKETLRINQ